MFGSGEVATPQAEQSSSEPATTWSPGRSGSAEFSFTYTDDRLSRLTAVTGPDGARTYTYDPVGNRTPKVLGSSTSYTYDRADRITAAGATALTVDAAGNLVARGADTFTYDAANRPTTATGSGSVAGSAATRRPAT